MGKTKEKTKQPDLRFYKAEDWDLNPELKCKLDCFRDNQYGLSIIVETDKGNLIGINLKSVVLSKLVKIAVQRRLMVRGVDLVIVKGDQPKGKKYYNWELYVNGERIENKLELDQDEILNML